MNQLCNQLMTASINKHQLINDTIITIPQSTYNKPPNKKMRRTKTRPSRMSFRIPAKTKYRRKQRYDNNKKCQTTLKSTHRTAIDHDKNLMFDAPSTKPILPNQFYPSQYSIFNHRVPMSGQLLARIVPRPVIYQSLYKASPTTSFNCR